MLNKSATKAVAHVMNNLGYLESNVEGVELDFGTNYLLDRSQPGYKDISAVLLNRWIDLS